MAPTSSPKRARYGTRQFIIQALEAPNAKQGLKTSELTSMVSKLAGKAIPGPTVFQAARALVRSKALQAARDGREFRFTSAGSPAADTKPSMNSPSPPKPEDATEATVRIERELSAPPGASLSSEELLAGQSVVPSTLPHRLEPGQVLVLRHDESAIVTVSNVHGRVVVEKHNIP